jgi:hypothetical protein
LIKLAQVSGVETPTRVDLARLDRRRKKKESNDDWTHPHDPDAKITKSMKDGRTHLAHKAEHAVDLETGAIVGVTVQDAYETGGLRRVYLRGHTNIRKRVLIHAGGFNLGLLMRELIGLGTPRGLQGRLIAVVTTVLTLFRPLWNLVARHGRPVQHVSPIERYGITQPALVSIDVREMACRCLRRLKTWSTDAADEAASH